MQPRLKIIGIAILAWSCLTWPAGPVQAGKIAVVISRNLDMYQAALEGFRNTAASEYQIYNIDADAEVLKNITAADASLAVMIGTDALKAHAFLNPEIPVCYTMLLQSPDWTNRKTFGTVLKIDFNDQFLRMRKMFPGRKRVGALYHPRHSGPDADQAAALAGKYGLALNAIPVERLEQIPDALRRLTADQVDLLWSLIDEMMAQPAAVKYLVQHAWKENLPTIGFSSNQVRAGYLAAFSPDYFDIGAQTAEMAEDYLAKGRKMLPAAAAPRKIVIFINLRVQNKLHMEYLSEFPGVQLVQ